MSPSASPIDVLAARRRFFGDGSEPVGLVPATILRSWRRCAERGFDSHFGPRIEPVGSAGLRELQDRNELLIRACRPELDALATAARNAGSLAIITDASGNVLDAAGDADFAGKAAGVALRPGVKWAEASTGTNAIGTALVERRAVEVHGSEHYFEPHRILTCAAAPIFDPRGHLLGALDISANSASPQGNARSLIRAGVDQIEHRMFAEGFERCDVVRFHADVARLGTPQEGVLMFEGARLVAANRAALAMLGIDWNALGARSFGDLFDSGGLATSDDCQLRTRTGELLRARVRRSGATVRPTPAPSETASKPSAAIWPVFDAAARSNLQRAVKLVDGDVPILIQGETGSGKEIFARAVHASGSRASKPFVAVNCAAIPEGLIEAELFGYEQGAFTGARKAGSKGLLREADGGVLFLDEIGDMPVMLQARLLRVVQDRAVTPLGGGREAPIDIRLICATHRDLKSLTASEAFRPDLYFRLAQFTFALKPFRELDDRIGALDEIWRILPRDGRTLSPAARELMSRYDWPGNHRELVGVLKATIALSEPGEAIGPELLPASVHLGARQAPAPGPEGQLDALARGAMISTIEACGGNVTAAARRLGVSRSTLYRRALGKADA